MNRYRLLLIVLTFVAALPLAADDPTPADSPSPNTSCEEDPCKMTDEMVGKAILRLNMAMAAGSERDLRKIEGALQKKLGRCRKGRTFDPEREALRKLIEKLRKGSSDGGVDPNVLGGEAWLNVAREWEEFERRCNETKTETPPPLFQQNPQIDFLADMTEEDILRLLERLDDIMRKITRQALLRPNHPRCSEHNRQIIIRSIDVNGKLVRR